MNWGKFLTSKTVWVSVLTVIGGVIEFLAGLPVAASGATVALGVLNVVIRYFTTDAIKG